MRAFDAGSPSTLNNAGVGQNKQGPGLHFSGQHHHCMAFGSVLHLLMAAPPSQPLDHVK